MANLADKKHCSGCTACFAVCPRRAISMRQDEEGFAYPQIDASVCVNCGLCEKVCPSLNQPPERKPLAVYAAKAKDDALRLESSSGGIFSLFARNVLSQGGLVFGAAFDQSDWHVHHKCIDDENGLRELRGSKYVQSDMEDCFREVKTALDIGKMVLFSGTPCQIAGLRSFLGKAYDNLLLVDVVCHAAPSPLAWKKYLEKRLSVADESCCSSLKRISFRRKNCGWKRYSLSLRFANNKEYHSIFSDDSFMRGFLAELYNRPSCHNCHAKSLSSGADITIADYWGVATRFPDMDDDKGTSLVIVNTDKGVKAFTALLDKVNLKDSDFAHAVAYNPAIVKATIQHRNRSRFFRCVSKADFDLIVNRMLQPSIEGRIRIFIGRVLRKIGLRK